MVGRIRLVKERFHSRIIHRFTIQTGSNAIPFNHANACWWHQIPGGLWLSFIMGNWGEPVKMDFAAVALSHAYSSSFHSVTADITRNHCFVVGMLLADLLRNGLPKELVLEQHNTETEKQSSCRRFVRPLPPKLVLHGRGTLRAAKVQLKRRKTPPRIARWQG